MTLLPEVDPDRICALFMELAAVASPSRRERAVADLVAARLRALGLEVEEDDAAAQIGGDTGNLRCLVYGDGERPAVTLAAHLDTVEPEGPLEPVLEDGIVRNAAGTILGADNKAAVAALLHATERLRGAGVPFPTYELVFSVAEELSVLGSRHLAAGVPSAPLAAVFDSSGPAGGIVVRAPSQQTIRAEFKGRAAHAGLEPELGRNAIQGAAFAIAAMRLGRLDEETTANVGLIEGGVAQNIVPAHCSLRAESRSLDEAKLAETTGAMVDALQEGAARAAVDLDLDVVMEYRAFGLSRNHPVVRLGRAAVESLGLEPRYVSSGGGSDANEFNARGVPTINLDCGMMRVHTPEEYIGVADLVTLVRLVEAVITLARVGEGGTG
ncbi:MAG: M20/M25/M40 family metallo-hydrolase [Thermoleophilia bacterium]